MTLVFLLIKKTVTLSMCSVLFVYVSVLPVFSIGLLSVQKAWGSNSIPDLTADLKINVGWNSSVGCVLGSLS